MVISFTHVGLFLFLFLHLQKILENKKIYNMILGLWSESTSNGFLVDTSAPMITTTPTFSADFGINGLKQVYRTSMKVEWAVDDDESYIKRQYLSVNSHIGGEFMLSSQSVSWHHTLVFLNFKCLLF